MGSGAVGSFPAKIKGSQGSGGERSFSSFASIVKVAVGILLLPFGIAGVSLVALKKFHTCSFSTLFLGESREYDAQRSAELGVDVTVLMPKMIEGLLAMVFGRPLKKLGKGELVEEKARSAFQGIVETFPNHFIGYALLAWLERSNCRLVEAKRLLDQALEVADAYPEENAGLIHLLPDPTNFFKIQDTDEELAELADIIEVTDNVWAVGAPFCVDRSGPVQDPFFIQATVVKQANGEVAVINPTHFSPATVEFINRIGPVTSIVTTTLAHGEALDICKQNIWPEAKIIGTSQDRKHDNHHLSWDGFLTTDGVVTQEGNKVDPSHLFNGEFEFQALSGHIFQEVALYHRPSSTLTGITDMCLSVERPASRRPERWGVLAYGFALGLDRGHASPMLLPQSYHLIFCTDRLLLGCCLQEMVTRFRPEHVVLGHGGVIHGRNLCEYELRKAFKWVFDVCDADSQTLTHKLDSLYMPVAWLTNAKLVTYMMKVFGASASLDNNRKNNLQ